MSPSQPSVRLTCWILCRGQHLSNVQDLCSLVCWSNTDILIHLAEGLQHANINMRIFSKWVWLEEGLHHISTTWVQNLRGVEPSECYSYRGPRKRSSENKCGFFYNNVNWFCIISVCIIEGNVTGIMRQVVTISDASAHCGPLLSIRAPTNLPPPQMTGVCWMGCFCPQLLIRPVGFLGCTFPEV